MMMVLFFCLFSLSDILNKEQLDSIAVAATEMHISWRIRVSERNKGSVQQ